MFKRLVVCIFLTSLLCTALWCEQAPAPQSASVSVADWVLAGSVFTLKSPLFQNTASLEQVASTLPSLILENLSDTGVRVLAPQEILERKLLLNLTRNPHERSLPFRLALPQSVFCPVLLVKLL